MDYRVALLLITAGANFGLAFFIYLKDFRSSINLFFSLMLAAISAWSLSLAMYYSSVNVEGLYFWIKFNYTFAAFIAFFFYYFCINFPYERKKIDYRWHLFNISFLALTLFIIFSVGVEQDFIFDSLRGFPSKVNVLGYSIFSLFFYFYIISSFVELFKKWRNSSSSHRRSIAVVFIATLLAAIFGALFSLILVPFMTNSAWVGPLFTMIMVFIIVRYLFIKSPE